jgi:hypothetical protein
MSDYTGLAHNDEDGNVYCHRCQWTAGPYASFEMAEAAISEHLKSVHGLACRYAVEGESGTVRMTPDESARQPQPSDLGDCLLLLLRLSRAVMRTGNNSIDQQRQIAHRALAWLGKIGYDGTRSPLRNAEDGK